MNAALPGIIAIEQQQLYSLSVLRKICVIQNIKDQL